MTGFFQRIFGRLKRDPIDGPTLPLPKETNEQTEIEPAETVAAVDAVEVEPRQLISACAQSVGLLRDHNEDSLFTLTTALATDKVQLPFGLYIVADGMGGHRSGEVASDVAVRIMASHVVKRLYEPLLRSENSAPDVSIQEVMQEGVQEAHQAINKAAPGGGTTLTAALILGSQLTIAHVGDSRAYHISSKGGMKALTRDHSLVQRLVELGQLSDEEAAIHPQRNVLYRALGQGEPLDPDIQTFPLPEDGCLLICSDGLWGVASENDILNFAVHTPSPQEACQQMVAAANQAGGPDNITVILIRLPH